MESLLYYQVCFAISVLLSFAYICLWHDGIDVSITCLFILIPIVCLGCVWMYEAPSEEVAVLSNKLVYLAGCFWPLLATKAIFSLCSIKIPKMATIIAYITSFIFYGFALSTDKPGLLYKSIEYVRVDGRVELYPEYGFMHTVIYIAMVLYLFFGIGALIYGMKNKVRASIKNMWIMLIGEFFTMVVFFIYGINKLAGSPAVLYVFSQFLFLVTGYRSYYYDIDHSVMDTVVAEGKLGYITFDKNKRMMGCNPLSESYFPEMKTTRVDKPLDNLEGIKKTLSDCMDSIEKNHCSIEMIIPCKDRFISLKADEYRTRGRMKMYRFILNDDTDHQNYIALLNKEKKEAEERSEHISGYFHRYVDLNIADTILSGSEAFNVEQNIAVLFADIRGFTTYSENREPKEVLDLLNQILEIITFHIKKNNGIVDKFIGDCVMAAWNDKDERKSVYCACKAALEAQQAMEEFSLNIKEKSGRDLHVGIGINFGKVIIGDVGSRDRKDYTAIGNTVNLANRIEGIAKGGTVLVSPSVKEILKDDGEFELYKENAVLKGVASPIHIYCLKEIHPSSEFQFIKND